MYNLKSYLIISFIFIYGGSSFIYGQNNTINGMVFDAQSRQPVSDIYVELMNQVGMTIKRIRIESNGRFSFERLPAGAYKVKIITFDTNYQEQSQDVNLIDFARQEGGRSSDSAFLDFYLKLDPRKINTGAVTIASAVFNQDIPPEASKLYKKALKLLDDKKDEGLVNLKKAIEIFPTYYDALDRLGTEYMQRRDYGNALPLLVKAIDINPRSFSSYYGIGIAALNLNQINDAIKALDSAVILNSASINAQLRYGMALRINKEYVKAEKALLQAKELEKNSPVADVHWELALLYEKTSRFNESANELEIYLKIRPQAPNIDQIKNLIEKLRAKTREK